MTSRPWMPLYIADYRGKTAHLSAAEHGAYLLLIMHYWMSGSVPIEDGPLARIACMTTTEWKRVRPTIAAFFSPDWKHNRIDAEIAKMVDISNKRRASAEVRHSKSNANAEQMQSKRTHTSHSHLTKKETEQDAANAANGSERQISPDEKTQFYARFKAVIAGNSGGLATQLLQAKGENVALARAALETATTKANPREYIGGIIRGKETSGVSMDEHGRELYSW